MADTTDSSGIVGTASETEPLWQRAYRLLQPGPDEHYPPCKISAKGPVCSHAMQEHWRTQFAGKWVWLLNDLLDVPPNKGRRLMRDFLLDLAEVTHIKRWEQDQLPNFTYLLDIEDWLLNNNRRLGAKSQRSLERAIGQAAHAHIIQVISRSDLQGTIELCWNENWTEWATPEVVPPEKLSRFLAFSLNQLTEACDQLERALAWFQDLSHERAEKVCRAWTSLARYQQQRDELYRNKHQGVRASVLPPRPDEPLWQYVSRMGHPEPGEHYPPCEVPPKGPVCPHIHVEWRRKRLMDAVVSLYEGLVGQFSGRNHTLAYHVLTDLARTTLAPEAGPPLQISFELNNEDWHVAHSNQGCAVQHNIDWVIDQALQAHILLRTHERDYLGTVGLRWNENWTEWHYIPDLEPTQHDEEIVAGLQQNYEHHLLNACAEVEQELLARQDPAYEQEYQQWIVLERSWLQYEKLAAEAGVTFQ